MGYAAIELFAEQLYDKYECFDLPVKILFPTADAGIIKCFVFHIVPP